MPCSHPPGAHPSGGRELTNNHHVEVESFANTLPVPLVGQVGETNVASQLPANDVLHICCGLSNGLGVLRADSLGITGSHGVATLHEGRARLAARGGFHGRTGGPVGRGRRRGCIGERRVSSGLRILVVAAVRGRFPPKRTGRMALGSQWGRRIEAFWV